MSNENIAVVFDTNFIIAHISDLKEINAKFREKGYTPFITQISIRERISQKYLKAKNDYDKLNDFKIKYRGIATVNEKKTFDEYCDKEEQFTLQGYEQEFPEQIIPFNPSENILIEIMDRVFKKLPPFIEGESDRGFKDTLLWFSILDYFSSNKYDEVIFITDDKGFGNGKSNEKLCNEFTNQTNINITIKKNDYYIELIEEQENDSIIQTEQNTKNHLSTSEKIKLREKINHCTDDIMWLKIYDYDGEYYNDKTFTSNIKFDEFWLDLFFDTLSNKLEKLIFQSEVTVSEIFDLNGQVSNNHPISLENVEALNELYIDIKNNYSEYLNQFYIAVANKFNQFYQPELIDSDDLPF